MFRKFLTLSTIASVVLHALLGCCVHHAHACCSGEHCVESAPLQGSTGQHQPLVDAHPELESHPEHGHDHGSQTGHHASCSRPAGGVAMVIGESNGIATCECVDDQACYPGSGSHHGPHESCDEPHCNIFSDQRDLSVAFPVFCDWTPLLLDDLLVSAQDVVARRKEFVSPPDRQSVGPPIRLQKQVWRL